MNEQILAGHPQQASLLARINGLQGGNQPTTQLHLDENDSLAIQGDNIKLSATATEVTIEQPVASTAQEMGGRRLAGLSPFDRIHDAASTTSKARPPARRRQCNRGHNRSRRTCRFALLCEPAGSVLLKRR